MDPESQELQLRRAGVPWENLFRDIGVSGSTGTQERRGWHRLDNRLAGGDSIRMMAWFSAPTAVRKCSRAATVTTAGTPRRNPEANAP